MPQKERTVDEMSRLFDEAYHRAHELFTEYNPCQIRIDEDGDATCVAKGKPGQVCCIDCDYHSYDGCTVMCLGCKLALCGSAGDHKELRKKLHQIEADIPHYFVYMGRIRMPKEKVLEELERYVDVVGRR